VSDAKSDAADATLAVRDLKISLTDFRDSLTSKDTQIEATISINAESAKKIRDKVSDDIVPDVNQLKTDVGTATSIAQAALNLALRKKDK
jgi:hypothetical protein